MAISDFTPIGARFSRLVVISNYWSDKFHIKRVRCLCDCGTETEASCQQLVKGIKKSCGCLKGEASRLRAQRLVEKGVTRSIAIGERFGRLTVAGNVEVRANGKKYVACACDCGGSKAVSASQLRSGRTQSCGCLQRESQEKVHPTPIGQRFGKLVVLGKAGSHSSGRMVAAQCDCGNFTVANINNMRNGHTKSCGCMKAAGGERSVKHGHSRKKGFNRTYSIYRDMRTRCENPKYREFHLYGGRGITVCERWRQGYEFFLADMGERPPGMSLERQRVNEGYSPDNCKWATDEEQANNKRNNVVIEYNGKRLTIAQWSRELNMKAGTLYHRASKGWPPEKILAA